MRGSSSQTPRAISPRRWFRASAWWAYSIPPRVKDSPLPPSAGIHVKVAPPRTVFGASQCVAGSIPIHPPVDRLPRPWPPTADPSRATSAAIAAYQSGHRASLVCHQCGSAKTTRATSRYGTHPLSANTSHDTRGNRSRSAMATIN